MIIRGDYKVVSEFIIATMEEGCGEHCLGYDHTSFIHGPLTCKRGPLVGGAASTDTWRF